MKSPNIQLLHQYVLIRPLKKESQEVGDSGILLSEESDQFAYGEVVKVGTGRVLDSGEIHREPLSEGSKVMYKTAGEQKIVLDGEQYSLVSDVAIVLIKEE